MDCSNLSRQCDIGNGARTLVAQCTLRSTSRIGARVFPRGETIADLRRSCHRAGMDWTDLIYLLPVKALLWGVAILAALVAIMLCVH
ncbi:MAG: hypothetical protein JWO25_3929 [Alphaproteobacteria bacterium]|nr:hypothetical protein [Alphaproteobacteria bacterium]